MHQSEILRRIAGLLVCCACAASQRVNAQEPVATEPPLEEILVVGEQPGPAMWRVSKGEHSLWILATLEPLPKDMVWRSKSVDERIAASQLVLSPPELSAHVGFFRSLTLVSSLLRARHAPNGQTLEQSLPHDLYIRWLALRVKYLGNADDEKLRPLLAAADLYRHAIDQVGLTHNSHVWQRIEATARAKHIPVQPVDLEVPIDNPKQYVRDLSAIPSASEIDCLRSTVELVETQLPVMRTRANLWSTGDIERLRGLLRPDAAETCASAVLVVPSFQGGVFQAQRAASRGMARGRRGGHVGECELGGRAVHDGTGEARRLAGIVSRPGLRDN